MAPVAQESCGLVVVHYCCPLKGAESTVNFAPFAVHKLLTGVNDYIHVMYVRLLLFWHLDVDVGNSLELERQTLR